MKNYISRIPARLLAVCAGALAGLSSYGQAFQLSGTRPFEVGIRGGSSVIADVNGDGAGDLVIAGLVTQPTFGKAVQVLLGNNRGEFKLAPGSPSPLGPNFLALTAGDFDGDGKVDLIASYPEGFWSMRGDGAGGFKEVSWTRTYQWVRDLKMADFNGDGKLDAVTTLGTAIPGYEEYLAVWLGDGAGGFTEAPRPDMQGNAPQNLVVGDINGDGLPDVVTWCVDPAVFFTWQQKLLVLLGDGKGGFTTRVSIVDVRLGPTSIGLGDANGDGKLDVILVLKGGGIQTILGDGKGGFLPDIIESTPALGDPQSLLVGDFNRDGKVDVAMAVWPSIDVRLGDGIGHFPQKPADLPYTIPDVPPELLAFGDLNGDGAGDIFASYENLGAILLNTTPVQPAVTVLQTRANEGDGVATITLERNGSSEKPLAFNVGTVDDTAKAGRDYTAWNGRVEFAPGQSRATVQIPLANDDFGSGPRRFLLNFTGASTSVILPWTTAVDIEEDDSRVIFSTPLPTYVTLSEADGVLVVPILRSGSLNSTRTARVHYATQADGAQPARDYIEIEGALEFGPGIERQELRVPITNDSVVWDGDSRRFKLLLTGEGEAYAGLPITIEVEIADDERSVYTTEIGTQLFLPGGAVGPSPQKDGGVILITSLPPEVGTTNPLWRSALVKLGPAGAIDPNWGEGGYLVLPPYAEQGQTFGDGGQIVSPDGQVVKFYGEPGEAKRTVADHYDSKGRLRASIDLTGGNISVLVVYPDGKLLMNSDEGFRRLNVDGTNDETFHHGPPLRDSASARVDAQGRIYLAGKAALGGTLGPVIRFSPEGDLDQSYAPAAGHAEMYLLNIAPDGTLLLGEILPDQYNTLARITPDGKLTTTKTDGTGFLIGATILSDGRLLVQHGGFCGMQNCYWGFSLVDEAGHATRWASVEEVTGVAFDEHGIWSVSWSDRLGWIGLLHRTLPDAQPRAGFSATRAVISRNEPALRLVRSGDTTAPATVEGRMTPLKGAGLDLAATKDFQVNFASNQGDVALDLAAFLSGEPVQELVLTIDKAAGTDLSPFNSCNVIVLTPPSPGPVSLRFTSFPSGKAAGIQLLESLNIPEGAYAQLERSDDFTAWNGGFYNLGTAGSGLRFYPVTIIGSKGGFYRLTVGGP